MEGRAQISRIATPITKIRSARRYARVILIAGGKRLS